MTLESHFRIYMRSRHILVIIKPRLENRSSALSTCQKGKPNKMKILNEIKIKSEPICSCTTDTLIITSV